MKNVTQRAFRLPNYGILLSIKPEMEKAMNEYTANLELVTESQRRDDDAIHDRRTEAELVAAVRSRYLTEPPTYNGVFVPSAEYGKNPC